MSLTHLRHQLDSIDRQIVNLLARRQQIVTVIADHKHRHRQSVSQPQRETQLISQQVKLAKHLHLSASFVRRLFRLILDYSTSSQNRIIKTKA